MSTAEIRHVYASLEAPTALCGSPEPKLGSQNWENVDPATICRACWALWWPWDRQRLAALDVEMAGRWLFTLGVLLDLQRACDVATESIGGVAPAFAHDQQMAATVARYLAAVEMPAEMAEALEAGLQAPGEGLDPRQAKMLELARQQHAELKARREEWANG